MTPSASLSCPKCRASLPENLAPPGSPRACGSCGQPVEGLVFPAYYRPLASGKAAETLVALEDAGCFYHPQSRAQVPCDACGRFLCALCDIELGGQHLCPACVNSGSKKKRLHQLDGNRVLYGGIALMVGFLPLIVFWPLTIVTGPLTIFIAIYGWRKPLSLTGPNRLSYVLAIILGLLQIVGWALAITGLFNLF